MAHAQQGGGVQVAVGLFDDAVAGIEQQHDQLGGGHAGHGVAGVLHVAGGVGEDEGPLVGGEVAVGHVDGDALFALGAQAIDKQGEVHAVEAAVGGGALDGLELVHQDRLGVVEEAADEGGLAVVHGTGRAQAQGFSGFKH